MQITTAKQINKVMPNETLSLLKQHGNSINYTNDDGYPIAKIVYHYHYKTEFNVF